MIKIKLQAKHVEGKILISPQCEASKKLFHFLNKQHIFPTDLPVLAKIGFEVNIKGETGRISYELDKSKEDFVQEEKGQVTLYAKCPLCGKTQD